MHCVIAFHNNGDHSLKPELYGPFECYQDALDAKNSIQYLEENAVVLTMRAKSYDKKEYDRCVQRLQDENRLIASVMSDYKKKQRASSVVNVPLV